MAIAAGSSLVRRQAGFDGAEPVEFRGGHALAGEHHPPHLRGRQDALEEARAAAEADIDLRHRENGVVGGKNHVAAGGQDEAGAEGGAVHRGDDRLLQFEDRKEAVAGEPVGAAVIAGRGAKGLLFLHVGAGAEDLSGRGQHDGADVVAVLKSVEGVHEFLPQGAGKRVDRRPVEGHDRDMRRGDFHGYEALLLLVARQPSLPFSGHHRGRLNCFNHNSCDRAFRAPPPCGASQFTLRGCGSKPSKRSASHLSPPAGRGLPKAASLRSRRG